MRIDPLAASRQIAETYARYLGTTFLLSDPDLREQFHTLLRRPGFLCRGPYLEATPPFAAGVTVQQLMEAEVLCRGMQPLDGTGFPGPGYPLARPLYAHQEHAVRKVAAGRNVVVATGTGSGKTESFLLPILDHLMREEQNGTLGRPGVRALLLYPMNALANDQLGRLRRMLQNVPQVTFGRYTGQTEETVTKAEDQFRKLFPDHPRPENELIAREQIRDAPPHILLTNYAMLEYLLLRPQDTSLFDGDTGKHWAFIVVDEAHSYSGAAGMEVGMLLRRLKDRVVKSEPGRVRCIATSATLAGGEDDYLQVAGFAQALFGESFEWVPGEPDRQDIVPPLRVETEISATHTTSPPTRAYAELDEAGDDPEAVRRVLETHGASPLQGSERGADTGVPELLHSALREDGRVRRLQALLQGKPVALEVVADELFGEGHDGAKALGHLVSLCNRARSSEEAAPLLPARYHAFARALEGAFITFPQAGRAQLHLEALEEAGEGETRSRAFEVATCRRCGELFLVGDVCSSPEAPGVGVLRPGSRHADDQARGRFFYWCRPARSDVDEDEAVLEDGGDDPAETSDWTLCTCCGAIAEDSISAGCGCPADRALTVHEANTRNGRLATCPICGAQSRQGDIAVRFVTGAEAPVAVLGTALYQHLPEAPECSQVAGGRKLLVFADSRQSAAYFAPYFENSHADLLHRRLIVEALAAHHGKHGDAPARPRSLAEGALREVTDQYRLFPQPSDVAAEHQARCTWLFAELRGYERRINLEGTCLMAVSYSQPAQWTPPETLTQDMGMRPEEAWVLAEAMLDTLRLSGAIDVEPANVTDPEFEPQNRLVFAREVGAETAGGVSVVSWLPNWTHGEHVTNRRFKLLHKLMSARLEREPEKEEVRQVLQDLWRSLASTGVLASTQLRQLGVAYQINPAYVELMDGRSATVKWWRCRRCDSVSHRHLNGMCQSGHCDGTPELLDPEEELCRDHYRTAYLEMMPVPIQVREHTAQWSPQKAAEIQQEFISGGVNALSCSTTFELGVDVGELQAVLMSNVPPSTARYVQRAGRAGRRTDAAAFALTHARARPHDLTFFRTLEDLIAGRIKPPAIEIRNPKIARRHVHSVVLARLFRQHPECFGRVGGFFLEKDSVPVGPDLLREMLDKRPGAIREELDRILPDDPEIRRELQLDEWGWTAELAGRSDDGAVVGVLTLAAEEVAAELGEYEQLEQDAAKEGKYQKADRFRRQRQRITKRQLIDFLASRNVLPKYGFPVDVVSLWLAPTGGVATELELERDLRIAVSEYAPGAQVVAGHHLWTSNGIRRLPERDPQTIAYCVCPHCGRFHRAITTDGLPAQCQACGEAVAGSGGIGGTMLVPEFGFFSNTEPQRPGSRRPIRQFASRVYFSEYADGDSAPPETVHYHAVPNPEWKVSYRCSRQGRLAVVNRGPAGRGYFICARCGFAQPVIEGRRRGRSHNSQYGRPCNGSSEMLHIGHEFLSDVLELRLRGPFTTSYGEKLWASLMYALLQGASMALGIERDDLDCCLYPYGGADMPPALVLFDSVPGGAGHVRRIAADLDAAFRSTLDVVANCEGCHKDAACYGCLKTYDNQHWHDVLVRGPVVQSLKSMGFE